MHVLIVGATGGTGQQLVKQAVERGHHVTALIRKRAPANSPASVIAAVGNVMNPGSLDSAMRGQEAVLSALGHKRWFGPRHGVRRFICETALGISDSWWEMGLYYTLFVRPVILPFYFKDKVRQEAIIRNSDLDWTIVRPGVLTDGPKRGTYRHGAHVGHWLWTVRISRADVAGFMLDQLTDRRYLRAVVGLAN
jgi:uncharacterized protein YbjT (DUF2867 family)